MQHLARTLDGPESVTAARLKTLVRQLGSSRAGPVATFLFAEGLVPVEHAVPVLAPDGARREASLRVALRDAEPALERLDPARAFDLTRALTAAATASESA